MCDVPLKFCDECELCIKLNWSFFCWLLLLLPLLHIGGMVVSVVAVVVVIDGLFWSPKRTQCTYNVHLDSVGWLHIAFHWIALYMYIRLLMHTHKKFAWQQLRHSVVSRRIRTMTVTVIFELLISSPCRGISGNSPMCLNYHEWFVQVLPFIFLWACKFVCTRLICTLWRCIEIFTSLIDIWSTSKRIEKMKTSQCQLWH